MNFKRKKSKRQVRCTMCTSWRWMGNKGERKRISDWKNVDRTREGMAELALERDIPVSLT